MTLRDRPELTSEHILPEEEEAIRILWEKENAAGDIPNEDAKRLLTQVREQKAQIESHVLNALRRNMKEGRREPRRHELTAFILLILIAGAVAIVAGVISLFR